MDINALNVEPRDDSSFTNYLLRSMNTNSHRSSRQFDHLGFMNQNCRLNVLPLKWVNGRKKKLKLKIPLESTCTLILNGWLWVECFILIQHTAIEKKASHFYRMFVVFFISIG